MSFIKNVINHPYFSRILSATHTVLNSKHPDEFELYMCSLELVSTKTKKTLSYFVFPIMPQSEDFTRQTSTNVIQTFGGVTTLKKTNFIPFDISLSGTFGRGYRVSVGNSFADISSYKSLGGMKTSQMLNEMFDPSIKSGYGYCRVLENMIEESQQVDGDGQRVLYFYNLSFNQRYVVEPMSLNFRQDMSSNMVWNYNLVLKAVAPLTMVGTFHDSQKASGSLTKDVVLRTASSKIISLIKTLF